VNISGNHVLKWRRRRRRRRRRERRRNFLLGNPRFDHDPLPHYYPAYLLID
jgi:hypothetical protein